MRHRTGCRTPARASRVLALALLVPWPTLADSVATLAVDPAPDAAYALVRETTDAVLAAVADDSASTREIVDRLVSPLVDKERVARRVLGKYWGRASPEQRVRFVDEFRDLVIHTYAAAISAYARGAEVRYLQPRPPARPDDVTVRTRIPAPGARPVSVDYRLAYRRGAWKVYDVVVDGISLVKTYRGSFAGAVRRHGIDGLIEQLAEKNRADDGA